MSDSYKFMLNMQLSRSQFQGHPFHLVTPSPWPLLTSFALLILTIAAAMYFNGFANGGTLVAIGFITTVSAMILWFRDVVAEGTLLGNHTFAVQKGLNLGVALFIVSEIFFFVSIFWASKRVLSHIYHPTVPNKVGKDVDEREQHSYMLGRQ